jgi:hypothetical protein
LEIPPTPCIRFLKIVFIRHWSSRGSFALAARDCASGAQRRLRVDVWAAGARAPLPPLRGPAVDLRSAGAASTRSGANRCEPATNLISRRFMGCFLSARPGEVSAHQRLCVLWTGNRGAADRHPMPVSGTKVAMHSTGSIVAGTGVVSVVAGDRALATLAVVHRFDRRPHLMQVHRASEKRVRSM